MSTEKATAIVLRVVDFSETSAVVTLLTREHGKVCALAKGARRLKGPFESALDLLALCRVVFLRKSSDALDLLTEAKLDRRFRPADRDLAGLYAGYYVAELLSELTDDYDPHPELFNLADNTLEELSRGGPVARLVLRFELMALHLLGHLPMLDGCVECAAEIGGDRRIAFGTLAGGVLCKDCRVGKKQVVSVSAPVIEAMRCFTQLSTETWRKTALDRPTHGELRAVLNRYLNDLVGHPLKMHAYLGTICT